MVGIQALTGEYPHLLQEDDKTGEIIWQNLVPVSAGLAAVLTQMVRYHFKDRYQSATEVIQALQQLVPHDRQPNKMPLLPIMGVAAVVSALGVPAILQSPLFSHSTTSVNFQQSTTSRTTSSENCVVVFGKNLNIRSGPGGEKTGKLVQIGTKLTVTKREEGGWIEISTPIAGWVWKKNTTTDCSQAINPTPNLIVETNQLQK